MVWLWSLAGAGTTAFVLPDLYRATATVLVDRRQISDGFVSPALATSELETRIQTLGQQALSRARLEGLIHQFDLYPDLRKRGVPGAYLAEGMRRDIKIDHTETVQAFQNITLAVRVSYLGTEPQKVAEVANALASFYASENSRVRKQQTSGNTQFLEAQVSEMKERVERQAARLNDYKLRNAGDLPEQVNANLAVLQRLQAEIRLNNDDQRRVLAAREAVAKQLADETVTPSTAARNPVAARLAELQRRLTELSSRVTDKHPDLIQIKSEIATLEAELAATAASKSAEDSNGAVPSSELVLKRLRKAMEQADAELATLKNNEQRLRQEVLTYEQRIENAPKLEGQFAELSRGYEAATEAYNASQKRYEDAQMAERIEGQSSGDQFRVLDSALPPGPIAPDRSRLLLMALALSLLLAGGAIVLAEKLDTSFHTIDGLRAFTRVPVAAAIPRINTSADAWRRRGRFCLGTLGALCGLGLIVTASWYFSHGNQELVRLLARGSL